jgi:hypothetical protein
MSASRFEVSPMGCDDVPAGFNDTADADTISLRTSSKPFIRELPETNFELTITKLFRFSLITSYQISGRRTI